MMRDHELRRMFGTLFLVAGAGIFVRFLMQVSVSGMHDYFTAALVFLWIGSFFAAAVFLIGSSHDECSEDEGRGVAYRQTALESITPSMPRVRPRWKRQVSEERK